MPGHAFDVVLLKEADYEKLYKEAFKKPTYSRTFTQKMHEAEFKRLDRGLRRALAARWEEDCCGNKDYAIMDEGETGSAWHHCGAIYSNRICCPAYVKAIMKVIAPLPHAALWTYHTACETWHDDAPLPEFGEFFIRGGRLYAMRDGNDYAKVFGGSEMKQSRKQRP
jgi:hypothetical protein